MKLRWLRPFIVLTAALIVCISNMVAKRPIVESLFWLLVVIIVFFIIATIGTRIILRTMNQASKEEPDEIEALENGGDSEQEEEKKE